jgi:hypothetical protein
VYLADKLGTQSFREEVSELESLFSLGFRFETFELGVTQFKLKRTCKSEKILLEIWEPCSPHPWAENWR